MLYSKGIIIDIVIIKITKSKINISGFARIIYYFFIDL